MLLTSKLSRLFLMMIHSQIDKDPCLRRERLKTFETGELCFIDLKISGCDIKSGSHDQSSREVTASAVFVIVFPLSRAQAGKAAVHHLPTSTFDI